MKLYISVLKKNILKMLIKDGGSSPRGKGADKDTENGEVAIDAAEEREKRFRRTDSIVTYKAKNGAFLNIRNSVEDDMKKIPNTYNDDSSESSNEDQEVEYLADYVPSSASATSNGNSPATSSINITTDSNVNSNNPDNSNPNQPAARRDSLDSNDPNFGYQDQPVYKTISIPHPIELKPITSPIPGRPVFKVEQTPENELINQSLIALRTSILQSNENRVHVTQHQFELIKKYKISVGERRTLIKDFAPNVFHDLRNRSKIDCTKFLKSWSSYFSNETPSKNNNSFTIYSSDRKYILKTVTKAESIKLRKLLPHYYDYLVYNSNSMLIRYLGLFRVEKRMNQNFYVVLLSNVFNNCCNVDQTVSTKTIGDSFKNKSYKKIQIDLALKNAIYKQIEKDTSFLSTNDLIDYNMVIGVNKIDSKNEQDTLVEAEQELTSSIQSHPPLLQDGLSSASSTPNSSVFTPQLNTSLNSSFGIGSSIDPVKTIPRLLFFLEEVECMTQSNNFTINKSLKKSFTTLPRSWTPDNAEDPIGRISPYSATSPLVHSAILQNSKNEMTSSMPPSLFNSLPTILPLKKRNSLQLSESLADDSSNGSNSSGNATESLPTNKNLSKLKVTSKLSSLSLSSSTSAPSPNQRRCINGFVSETGEEIYYICVMDILSSAELNNKKAPVKLMSKVRQSAPNGPNSFLKKFLNNAKSLLFLDNSVQTINPITISKPNTANISNTNTNSNNTNTNTNTTNTTNTKSKGSKIFGTIRK